LDIQWAHKANTNKFRGGDNMKKVFFESCGGLYFIGKVRKNYKVNEVIKLKNFLSKVKVTAIKNNEIIVIREA
jgi:hypothetical protein